MDEKTRKEYIQRMQNALRRLMFEETTGVSPHPVEGTVMQHTIYGERNEQN